MNGVNVLSWFKVIGIVLVLALLAYIGFNLPSWLKWLKDFSLGKPGENNAISRGADILLGVPKGETLGTALAIRNDSNTAFVESIDWRKPPTEAEKEFVRRNQLRDKAEEAEDNAVLSNSWLFTGGA